MHALVGRGRLLSDAATLESKLLKYRQHWDASQYLYLSKRPHVALLAVLQAKQRSTRLGEQVEDPSNSSRIRLLGGRIPEKEELVAKLQVCVLCCCCCHGNVAMFA